MARSENGRLSGKLEWKSEDEWFWLDVQNGTLETWRLSNVKTYKC